MMDITQKQALTVKEFCQWAGMGRSTFYKFVTNGRIVVRKIGRKNVVLVQDATAFMENLPAR